MIKNLISLLIAAIMLFGLASIAVSAEGGASAGGSQIVYGDANGDGRVSMKDVIALRKYLASFDKETGTSSTTVGAGADANGDGSITMKDIVILRRYLANYDQNTGTSNIVLGPVEGGDPGQIPVGPEQAEWL